jgi:hypothetical protein
MRILLKRLNKRRIYQWEMARALGFLVIIVGLVGLLVCIGCKKKERLTSSTFSFQISPPAASVLKTSSGITLTAKARSTDGSMDVNPTWSVSPETVGTLSSSIGSVVTFQPVGLGDAIVTATFEGASATAQLAVVTYQPTSNTFDVYNDNGLPSGSDVASDIFTSGGSFLSELSSGYTPEGTKYQRASGVSTGNFWGVTLDKNSAGKSKDLSAFSAGSLKFALRLVNRTLANTESIRLDVTDASNTTKSFTLASGSNGYNRLSTDWQEISIPLSNYAGADFAHIKVPFAVVVLGLSSSLTFDIDAIRWEKT